LAERDVFVCDTHSIAWFLTRDRKLSDRAREVLHDAQEGRALVHVPTIVLSEFLHMASRGKIPWDRLLRLIVATGPPSGFRVAPLDADTLSRMMYIALASPEWQRRLELHDLTILATASLLNASLITKDPKLLDQSLVETVW
jgi:predicted nucleic acid-binding protein